MDAVTTAVHDTTHRPSIVCLTWGSPEVTWTKAAIHVLDQAFQLAATMGLTVFAAVGDDGASGFPPGATAQPGAHVEFPASSPHVLACGGSRIAVSAGSITQEVVWNDPGDGATGGGFSSVFSRPAWQLMNTQGWASSGRGMPDVAANASPLSGYLVRLGGRMETIGGTGAAAALWSGLAALMAQRLGRPLGWLGPRLYTLSSHNPVFNSITRGNNNGYSAGPGWDPCTGWGSPNGVELLAALPGEKQGPLVR